MSRDTAIFAVRPRYAQEIFGREKTIELRRVRPKRIKSGSVVMVYVSSPQKALFGAFEVGRIVEKPVDQLWNIVHGKACISRGDFRSYFSGSSNGVAIFIGKTACLEEPVSLQELRTAIAGFNPPQSFRYATRKEIEFPVIRRMIRACSGGKISLS